MKIEVFSTVNDVMLRAADILTQSIKEKPDIVLGLPTGSTPVGMYEELKKRCAGKELSFKNVRTFNLDEYYPISPENECSYRYFMNKQLFCGIDIPIQNTHVPAGDAPDPELEGKRYDAMIAKAGGIDLQVLGVGRNGHIGFNEPSQQLEGGTHVTGLTQDTIDANARFFDSPDQVPRRAITMGLTNIMKAKRILLLATGKEKHSAIEQLLSGGITTEWPVTMLNMHPDVTVLCDAAAYSQLYLGVDVGGTCIKYGIIDQNGSIKVKKQQNTCTSSTKDLLEQIANTCKELASEYAFGAVGIGLPGCINPSGMVDDMANLPLKGVNVKEYMEKALGLPVYTDNDANCAAWGEYCESPKSGNMIMLTLGTGIGSGIIIDGELYRGSRGHAGELGHTVIHPGGIECACGQRGCFERYASASALCRLAEESAENAPDSILARCMSREISGKSFFEAVAQNCPLAKKVLCEYIDQLKIGIETVCRIFDPDRIVIGGGISGQKELFLDALREKCADIDIRQAVLGNDAGIIGAAKLAAKGYNA